MVSWWADYLVTRLGLGWVMLMGWMKASLSGYLWVGWKDYWKVGKSVEQMEMRWEWRMAASLDKGLVSTMGDW